MWINDNKLYSVAAIRTAEQLAQQQFQITESQLMAAAGRAAFSKLQQTWPQAKRITVFCGKGNNGGDGYVLAMLAKQHGLQVSVYHLGDIEKLPPIALQAAHDALQVGVECYPYTADLPLTADVLVDALLGIGARGTVTGELLAVIDHINESNLPVLALDVPSGIDAETGQLLGAAVMADVTVTFIGYKQGLFTGAAVSFVGECVCDDLQLPAALWQQLQASALLLDFSELQCFLKPRPRDSHKGDFGHVLIVGGDYGMAGAVCLAGMAAMRVGAGLVSVATHAEHVSLVTGHCSELMTHAVANAKSLERLLAHATVVAVGPGLGQSEWSQQLLQCVLATDLPCVVDADALNLLAAMCKPPTRANWILTPHPGEAARLLHTNNASIQEHRLAHARELQQRYGGVCVLKGAGTIITAENCVPMLCRAGNPGMASAGMGDVLTGITAGLLAQGLPSAIAAKLAVAVHARAGDRAASAGERGMMASDLLSCLRAIVNP